MDPHAPESRPAATVTAALRAARDGDERAIGRVFPLVLDELRQVARRQFRARGRPGTLDTDGLVNEAYLKLSAGASPTWEDRVHFFGIAARAMRQILVDYARRRGAAKRGGGVRAATLDTAHGGRSVDLDGLLALDQALDRLDRLSSRLREVVEYRFFGGLTEEEIAELLGISPRTVERDWKKARLFLHDQLSSPEGGPRSALDA